MTDGRSFVQALAVCHPTQATPLIRECNDEQLSALQQMTRKVLNGNIKMETKLPRNAKRLLTNVAFRHQSPKSLRRALCQRGGSRAVLAGQVLKAMAKAAVPALKKVGQKLAHQGISTGAQMAVDKLSSKNVSRPQDPDSFSASVSETKRGGEEDSDLLDELNQLLDGQET